MRWDDIRKAWGGKNYDLIVWDCYELYGMREWFTTIFSYHHLMLCFKFLLSKNAAAQ